MKTVDDIYRVRKLHYRQGWSIRKIARSLSISKNTVRKILRGDFTKMNYNREKPYPRFQLGGYEQKIEDLIKSPKCTQSGKTKLTAMRIYEILQGEGYKGCYEQVREYVKKVRKKLKKDKRKGYIPLEFRPGEAFQFDWSDVKAYLAGDLTKVYLASIRLCHSRHTFRMAYPFQKQEMMLDAMKRAFEYFGGVPARGIFDNLKSAVKEVLKGKRRNLQKKFVEFCSHYLFEPDMCNVAAGWEKGQVEKCIGDAKRGFFMPIPEYGSLEELNDALISYCEAGKKKTHPTNHAKTIGELFEEEKNALMRLPAYPFECCKGQEALVSALSLVQFEFCRYSVPCEYIGETVWVKGYPEQVVLSFEGREIARHKRAFEAGKEEYKPEHYLPLLERKPYGLRNGRPFMNWQLPEVFGKYRKALEEKYDDGLKRYVRVLLLLRQYEVDEIKEALEVCLKIKAIGEWCVENIIRRSKEKRLPSEETLTELPERLSRVNVVVDLNLYRIPGKEAANG